FSSFTRHCITMFSAFYCFCFFYCSVLRRDLHSFPTRRSSDLPGDERGEHRVAFEEPFTHEVGEHNDPREERSGFELGGPGDDERSEEHTSELQSRFDLVCRLLLEKKNITHNRVLVKH